MIKTNTKKLAIAGVFCAVAVVGSLFSFPVFGSKCSPVQHMVNILCAVLLGPGYGVGVAFAASLIRNMHIPLQFYSWELVQQMLHFMHISFHSLFLPQQAPLFQHF